MTARRPPWLPLFAAAALAGCAAVPDPGSAEACAFVKRAAVPIVMQRNVPLVQVTIDGSPATMVLDTGAEWSVVSEQAGRRMSLPTDFARYGITTGIGGEVIHDPLTADRFVLGELTLRQQSIGVGLVHPGDSAVLPDGYLGANILSRFDAEIDFPQGRLTLYRPRDCPAGGPPWTTPYRTVALRRPSPEHNLIAMAVYVDGKRLVATIDTGAEATVVARRTAAETLGIAPVALDGDRGGEMVGAGPATATWRLHTFREKDIAGDRSANPSLLVVDLPPFAGDMLLGVDYLRSHRIYLSYVTGRMFVADATPGALLSAER